MEIITKPSTECTISTDGVVEGDVVLLVMVVVEVEAMALAFTTVIISKVRPVNQLFIKATLTAENYIKTIGNIKEAIMEIIPEIIMNGNPHVINQMPMAKKDLRII